MKARLLYGLSALTLVMAGCSSTTEEEHKTTIYEVNADVLTLDEKNELKKQQQLEEQKARQYAQLYNTLNSAVNDFGIAANTEAAGVHYAELIDFNNDEIDELYILLKNDGKPSPNAPHRQIDGYVQEIWSNNGDKEVGKLSYSAQIPVVDETNSLTVSLIRDAEKTYISSLQEALLQEDAPAAETILELTKEAQPTETKFLKEQETFFINNKATEATQFVETRKAFSGTVQNLLTTNEDGSYSLPKTGATIVEPVLQTLQAKMTPKQ